MNGTLIPVREHRRDFVVTNGFANAVRVIGKQQSSKPPPLIGSLDPLNTLEKRFEGGHLADPWLNIRPKGQICSIQSITAVLEVEKRVRI